MLQVASLEQQWFLSCLFARNETYKRGVTGKTYIRVFVLHRVTYLFHSDYVGLGLILETFDMDILNGQIFNQTLFFSHKLKKKRVYTSIYCESLLFNFHMNL